MTTTTKVDPRVRMLLDDLSALLPYAQRQDGRGRLAAKDMDELIDRVITLRDSLAHEPAEYEDLDQDYPPETAEKLLADSSISHWLRNALTSALDRDCVDAANDAECLAAVLKARCETAAASV